MWRTPEGTRVLDGLEGELARVGLRTAVELIEAGIDSGEPWVFDVDQFDALTPEQQLALLAEVGQALWNKEVRSPDHSAVNEAAVYVIFRAVLTAVESEIDGASDSSVPVRQLICDLLSQAPWGDAKEGEDDDDFAIAPDCGDMSEWEFAIECIADGILWDRDFELDIFVVDSSPEKADFVKSYLGMEEDYFTSIASDPTDLTDVKRTLEKLIRGKPR